jgi:2-dehydropantoate 2-reductase
MVGAGAVGGFFGAELARSGANVTFVARGRRLDHLRGDGIRLVAPDGAVSAIPVNAVAASELTTPMDLVILAVKGTALEQALRDIRPGLGARTRQRVCATTTHKSNKQAKGSTDD